MKWYITYLLDHKKQKEIDLNFKEKSSVGFDVCTGAIKRVHIWIHKPMVEEAQTVGNDQQKFYCWRKHKFGLNFQAVCDARS